MTLVDLAGHEKYFRTTAYGLTGMGIRVRLDIFSGVVFGLVWHAGSRTFRLCVGTSCMLTGEGYLRVPLTAPILLPAFQGVFLTAPAFRRCQKLMGAMGKCGN